MARSHAKQKKRTLRRPIQARAAVTRASIVQAAAQVLSRRGYAATTTNHVAQRAGVSIGTLYEYFRDKQQLVAAVMDEHLDQGEALFERHAANLPPGVWSGPIEVGLGFFVDSFIDFHKHDPKLHRVLSSQVPPTKATTARIQALEVRSVEAMRQLFAEHPETRGSDLHIAAQICVQTVDALTHRWVIEPGGAPLAPKRLARELVALLAAYLRGARQP